MLSILIVAAIAVSIAIGYKTKINTGLLAMIFAYLIGCFGMGMKAKEVIVTWPVSTMFVIFSVSLFYSFAMVNGTLEKTARYLLYACRRHPGMLPFALYLASACIAALGAGFFTVMAFMAPITLMICKEVKMDPLVGAVAVNCGALSGANFMTSGSGIIFRDLMDDAGFTEQSFGYTATIFVCSVIFSLLLIAAFRFLPRSSRNIGRDVTFEKPEPFTKQQRQNLQLIITMMVVVLIFPILHIILPHANLITLINSRLDVGLVSIIFSVIALFMHLAPQREAISKVPWNTIIMICGVGMLIQIAIQAGTVKALSTWVGSNLPVWLVPAALSIVGAIMSFFSSTLGVVCPALFPLVPALAASTKIAPILLFTCIVIGAQSSAISPFSSGGSLILGSCNDEETRNQLFMRLLVIAVPCSILASTVFDVVLSLIL